VSELKEGTYEVPLKMVEQMIEDPRNIYLRSVGNQNIKGVIELIKEKNFLNYSGGHYEKVEDSVSTYSNYVSKIFSLSHLKIPFPSGIMRWGIRLGDLMRQGTDFNGLYLTLAKNKIGLSFDRGDWNDQIRYVVLFIEGLIGKKTDGVDLACRMQGLFVELQINLNIDSLDLTSRGKIDWMWIYLYLDAIMAMKVKNYVRMRSSIIACYGMMALRYRFKLSNAVMTNLMVASNLKDFHCQTSVSMDHYFMCSKENLNEYQTRSGNLLPRIEYGDDRIIIHLSSKIEENKEFYPMCSLIYSSSYNRLVMQQLLYCLSVDGASIDEVRLLKILQAEFPGIKTHKLNACVGILVMMGIMIMQDGNYVVKCGKLDVFKQLLGHWDRQENAAMGGILTSYMTSISGALGLDRAVSSKAFLPI